MTPLLYEATRRPLPVVLSTAVALTMLAGCADAHDLADSSAAPRPIPTASPSFESDSAIEDDLGALEQDGSRMVWRPGEDIFENLG